MEDKHALTEKLKVIETEVYNDKVDLKGIERKLEAAHQYEDELLERMQWAKKQKEELRNQFFQKATAISKKYDRMKEILDIFTGNFYRH